VRTHHRHWAISPHGRIGCCSVSGILQLGIRSPILVAQTAITLSNLSAGRFLLGLGACGPQVIEGLHGSSFSRPLTRMRETVDIVRQVLAAANLALR
jgi:alkanesulfonate monooxygenase SsuD/methylene tetrahydromethanopterin reductase-like flavin-dependent oxidoreductase (luciferase family)